MAIGARCASARPVKKASALMGAVLAITGCILTCREVVATSPSATVAFEKG